MSSMMQFLQKLCGKERKMRRNIRRAHLFAPDLKSIAEGMKPTPAKIRRCVVALIVPAQNAGRLEQDPAV